MTKLSDHQSTLTTKMLIVGDSGSGKTWSLASLASAGYNLRIMDLDNGIDILRSLLTDPKSIYDKSSLDRVDFETITDPMTNRSGKLIPTKATVWQRIAGMLSNWKSTSADFGSIATWTPREVLVIDSLSMATNAAVNFGQAMNARLGQKMTWDDIYSAQQLIEAFVQTLYDEGVRCQVIVMAHPDFIKDQNGIERGYPATVGNKLSPKLGRYFNNVIEAKSDGVGASRRRKLLTKGSGMMEVKTSNPGMVKAEYEIETGLAELFADLQGHQPPAAAAGTIAPVPAP